MTFDEKMTEYAKKADFIKALNPVVSDAISNISNIAYEVYENVTAEHAWFKEYLVVTYLGGAKAVRNCTGNSLSANFQELAKLLDGGYYDEVAYYSSLVPNGWERVDLNLNFKLKTICATGIVRLEDMMDAFTLCFSVDDVNRVLASLDPSLGTFEVFYFPEDGFRVDNTYTEGGVEATDTWEFSFRKAGR